jgi:hypothetical protein
MGESTRARLAAGAPFGEQLVSSPEEGRAIPRLLRSLRMAQPSVLVPWSPHRHSPYKQEVTGSIPVPPTESAGRRI